MIASASLIGSLDCGSLSNDCGVEFIFLVYIRETSDKFIEARNSDGSLSSWINSWAVLQQLQRYPRTSYFISWFWDYMRLEYGYSPLSPYSLSSKVVCMVFNPRFYSFNSSIWCWRRAILESLLSHFICISLNDCANFF
jgi:hypothetical protein